MHTGILTGAFAGAQRRELCDLVAKGLVERAPG